MTADELADEAERQVALMREQGWALTVVRVDFLEALAAALRELSRPRADVPRRTSGNTHAVQDSGAWWTEAWDYFHGPPAAGT